MTPCNALSTFQATTNDTLQPFLQKFVAMFFDDILVYTTRSSTEAEYRNIAQTFTELTWIYTLLTELQVSFTTPVIFCDNQSVVSIAHNPVFHSRTKHMEIDVFFVRQDFGQVALNCSYSSSRSVG